MGYWNVWVAILVVCGRFRNKTPSTTLGSDLDPDWNTYSFTVLPLSPSVFFLFILFSVKITRKSFQHGFQKNLQTFILCSGNTSLILNCPRIRCEDYTKHNAENDTMAVQGHKTYICATKNPELGKFRNGKQTNRKTCLEILIINCFVFNFHIFVCWNCRCTKYIQILRVNRSAHYCLWTGMTSLSKPAKKRQRFCLTTACCLWRHCLTLSSQPAVVQKEDIKICLNPFSLWSPFGGAFADSLTLNGSGVYCVWKMQRCRWRCGQWGSRCSNCRNAAAAYPRSSACSCRSASFEPGLSTYPSQLVCKSHCTCWGTCQSNLSQTEQ